jgi:hypothetical protein
MQDMENDGTASGGGNELYYSVLLFTDQNSRGGRKQVTRDDFSRNQRKFFGDATVAQIVDALRELVNDGLISIEFLGKDDFKVALTPAGVDCVLKIEGGELPQMGSQREAAPKAMADAPKSEVASPQPAPPSAPAMEPSSDIADAQVLPEEPQLEEGEVIQPVEPAVVPVVAVGETAVKNETIVNPPESAPVHGNEVMTGDDQDLEALREDLSKREKAVRERVKGLAQRETELVQREEEVDELRKRLEREVAEKRAAIDRKTRDLKTWLAKADERDKQISKREGALEERQKSLVEREKAISSHAQAIAEQEAAIEELEAERANLRQSLRKAHSELNEHVKKHQPTEQQ